MLQEWVFIDPSFVKECLNCLLADVSTKNTFIWFWAQRIVGGQNSVPMNSENWKVIRLVNCRHNDPGASPESKELMANHLNIKRFMIKHSKFACDKLRLLELLQELIKNQVSEINVWIWVPLDFYEWFLQRLLLLEVSRAKLLTRFFATEFVLRHAQDFIMEALVQGEVVIFTLLVEGRMFQIIQFFMLLLLIFFLYFQRAQTIFMRDE